MLKQQEKVRFLQSCTRWNFTQPQEPCVLNKHVTRIDSVCYLHGESHIQSGKLYNASSVKNIWETIRLVTLAVPSDSVSDYRNKIAQERKAKEEKERSSQKQSSKKQSDGIRPRPLEVYGAYRLCTHYVLRGACPSGNSECRFAHSQAERKAWEEERAKGTSEKRNVKKTPHASFSKWE